ncbi:unnamed protein product [Victoria cruziana]
MLLSGPSGKPCTVKLAKINDRLCFKDGWRTFAEENSLTEEELLLFEYDGKITFTVLVFNNTACERGALEDKVNGGASCSNASIIDTKEEENDDELRDTSCESNEDSSSTEVHEEKTKGKKPKNAASKQKYGKYFISRRRPVTHEEKRKALMSAISMESPFPTFIVTMKPTCVYKGFYVNIPVDFLREHHILGETRTIKLQNVDGREWAVRLLRRGDRGGLESGWSDFVYDNNLEEGDVCVFELIGDKKKMLVLKVVIFRVVEKTTRLRVSRTG